jgi:anthranilate/para-aminobenzoate synthase component I
VTKPMSADILRFLSYLVSLESAYGQGQVRVFCRSFNRNGFAKESDENFVQAQRLPKPLYEVLTPPEEKCEICVLVKEKTRIETPFQSQWLEFLKDASARKAPCWHLAPYLSFGQKDSPADAPYLAAEYESEGRFEWHQDVLKSVSFQESSENIQFQLWHQNQAPEESVSAIHPWEVNSLKKEFQMPNAHLKQACEKLIAWEVHGHCYLANLTHTLVVKPTNRFFPPSSSQLALHFFKKPIRFLFQSFLSDAKVSCGALGALVSSPERFVCITPEGWMATEPIKGTSPCEEHPTRQDCDFLWKNEKEICEQILVTDLLRNDLALVCETESIEVFEPFFLRQAGKMLQMQTTIFGRLTSSVYQDLDYLTALLPVGSVSGTPKKRVCEILTDLESPERGYYTGVAGVLFTDGSADSAVCIRSLFFEKRGLCAGAGSGITVLSRPDEEVAELNFKLISLLSYWSTT